MKRIAVILFLAVAAVAVPVRVIDVSHDQTELIQQIAPKLNRLRQIADAHKNEWNALSYEQKRKIIQSEKYPLVNLMWSIYKYLHNNWFGEAVQHGNI